MAGENDTNPDPDAWVELEHPAITGTYTCHPDAVPHWTDEDHGWRVVGEKPARKSAKTGQES